MNKKVVIGSRESKLAVLQSQMVRDYIVCKHPETDVEILTMKTTGDKILDRTLDKIGGKGLFVKELDRALSEGRSDLSVHSLKDMPMEVPEALPLVAFSRREDPRDVLVLPEGVREPDFFKTDRLFQFKKDSSAERTVSKGGVSICPGKCTDQTAEAGQRRIWSTGAGSSRTEKTWPGEPDLPLF